MQAIFLVLHKVECLNDVLVAVQNAGIQGGTIIESSGMLNTLKKNENFIIDSLRIFLENPRDESRVLFFVVKDEEVNTIKKAIDEALGGISKPNTGIMFGIPLSFVEGIKKDA